MSSSNTHADSGLIFYHQFQKTFWDSLTAGACSRVEATQRLTDLLPATLPSNEGALRKESTRPR